MASTPPIPKVKKQRGQREVLGIDGVILVVVRKWEDDLHFEFQKVEYQALPAKATAAGEHVSLLPHDR